jgi:nitrogenase molybdenum-iron protein NifN
MQGTDIKGAVHVFRQKYPEYSNIAVIPVNTPDFVGCLETGFAHAVEALLKELVPDSARVGIRVGQRPHQVTVLAGSMLTPSDVELLKETLESFGLRPVVIPDISDSLDGHAPDENFTSTPLTTGGVSVSEIETVGLSIATLVIGHSLRKAGEWLQTQTQVPSYYFDNLMGLAAFDEFLWTLQQISGIAVPPKFERQRAQLQDAMLDTHFMLGQMRVAIAADPDELYALSQLVIGMGGEVVAAVVPANADVLVNVPTAQIKIGDLEDLEKMAQENRAQLLMGNSHTVDSAARLGIPVLRASFPQYDYVGGYQRLWIGYKGTRQALFDLANLMLGAHAQHEIHPYHSIYSQKFEARNSTHAPEKTFAGSHT